MKNFKLLIISFIFVVIGIFTFMRNAFTVPVYIESPIMLSSTSLRNPATAGTEVRIKSIQVDDVELLPEIALTNGWKMDGDILSCYENDGLEHVISVPVNKASKVNIVFIGQKGSGNVSVTINNQENLIDLYRDSDWEEITWSYKAATKFSPYSRVDVIIEMTLMIWIIIKAIGFWKKCKC